MPNYGIPQTPSGSGPGWLGAVGGIVGFVISMAILIFTLYLYGRILHKAGYSGWLALLLVIPIVNLVLLIWFAFAHWPVEHDAALARQAQRPPGAAPGGGYQAPPPQAPQPPQGQGGYQPPPGGYPTPQH